MNQRVPLNTNLLFSNDLPDERAAEHNPHIVLLWKIAIFHRGGTIKTFELFAQIEPGSIFWTEKIKLILLTPRLE